MNPNKLPIGLFDSGVGGLTIWNEINHLLPNESTIYLADSKNAPYGMKTPEEILHLSIKNVEVLLSIGVKLIVIACNTATTNAVAELRKKYQIPIIGLEPALKPAALHSQTKKIGVLATKGTLASSKFREAIEKYKDVTFYEQAGFQLVQLIEKGYIESLEMHTLLKKYLQPMIDKGIDQLVLGCTHYPFLKDQIREILPPSIEIIDSGIAVAKRVQQVLDENQLHNDDQEKFHSFYINTDTRVMSTLLDNKFTVKYKEF